MKKIFPSPLVIFAVIFFSLSFESHCQSYSSDETTIGLLVESNFSGFRNDGITPSLTIGCATYQFQVGPRITFEQIAGNQNENAKDTYWDFGFRYGFFLRYNLTLFAAARCEFGTHRSSEDWYYEYPVYSTSYGLLLTDYSFNARTVENHFSFNSYLGLGAEIILVDKLYVTFLGGAGIKTLSGYTEHSNRDTGELIQESNWIFDNRGFSGMVSAGIGYRL